MVELTGSGTLLKVFACSGTTDLDDQDHSKTSMYGMEAFPYSILSVMDQSIMIHA